MQDIVSKCSALCHPPVVYSCHASLPVNAPSCATAPTLPPTCATSSPQCKSCFLLFCCCPVQSYFCLFSYLVQHPHLFGANLASFVLFVSQPVQYPQCNGNGNAIQIWPVFFSFASQPVQSPHLSSILPGKNWPRLAQLLLCYLPPYYLKGLLKCQKSCQRACQLSCHRLKSTPENEQMFCHLQLNEGGFCVKTRIKS